MDYDASRYPEYVDVHEFPDPDGRNVGRPSPPATDISAYRILLAYDASPGAERAVTFLESRDWPAGTKIRVVSSPAGVGPPVSTFAGLSEARAHDKRVKQILRRAQGDVAASLRQVGLDVEADLLRGRAAASILTDAQRFGADLIVVGSRGHGALKSFFIGSTSAYVADRASCAVLVAREAIPRRVLLVVDGSLHPQTTMVLSSYPAILGDARIRVLGVTPWQARYPRIEVSEAEMLSAFPASMGSATIGASEMVNSLMERLGEDGLSTDAEVCSGDLVPTVIAAATDWRADLVVMVAESEEAPSAMLRGTMATRVLQGVTASMLIVRPRSD